MNTLIDKAKTYIIELYKDKLDDENIPQVYHPITVAEIVSKMTNDIDVIVASYLHDVIEDFEVTPDELIQKFNSKVAELVLEVTHEGKKDNYGYYFPRLRTREGILIKLADRLHNISRMSSWNAERQAQYLRRTKFWKDGKDIS
jgi:GTP pyrophosphokinase